MLLNLASHGLSPALYRVMIIEPEFQVAMNDYLAFDLMPGFAHYFGAKNFKAYGGGLSLGLRIFPMGQGLASGFYLVPRFFSVLAGATGESVDAHTLQLGPSLELGVALHMRAFVINIGTGAGYAFTASGYDVNEDSSVRGLRFLANLSIGFGVR